MSRTFGFFGLLVAIAIGAYLLTFQVRLQEATPAEPARAAARVDAALDAARVQAAVAQLEAHRAQSGSYAGASLQGSPGVVLVRAEADVFCVQLGAGARLRHLSGPGGSLRPGSC